MTSKIGNERERNKTKWNGTSSKGEKIRSVPRTMKISSVSSFWKRRSQCFFFFLLFSFFFLDTACLNRDGTNLIGKSSGFPNPGIFREQIQLDVDRSNSKLLPFSLSATGFYPAREGRRRRRRGESTAVARISTWVNRNRVKRRKIRISTVFRESSCAYSFLSSNISSMSISSHR